MTSGATVKRHGERKKLVSIKGQLVSERQMTRKEVEHVSDPGMVAREPRSHSEEPSRA